MVRQWVVAAHSCILYRDDDEYRELLAVHLVTALERGERAAFLTDGLPPDLVAAWLPVPEPELSHLVTRGQVVVLPVAAHVVANGKLATERMAELFAEQLATALRRGFVGLHVCLEMTWALGEPAAERVRAYERDVNAELSSHRLTGLTLSCQYREPLVPPDLLDELKTAHTVALTAAEARRKEPLLRITPLEYGAGLRLSGEIDSSNLHELADALRGAADHDGDFEVCLADLGYAGVAAIRMLAQAAEELSDGHHLVLRFPGPLIRAVLRIYGWDQLPALRLMEVVDVG